MFENHDRWNYEVPQWASGDRLGEAPPVMKTRQARSSSRSSTVRPLPSSSILQGRFLWAPALILALFCGAWGCSDDDSGPRCGNGRVEGEEACDGEDLGGATCESLSMGIGDLACAADCTMDVSGCSNGLECGDGIIAGDEECEGQDLGGETCVSLGYTAGELICGYNCKLDISDCTGVGWDCGDGVQEGEEECDGDDLAGYDCVMLGFSGGTLACDHTCLFDTSGCDQ